MEGFDVVVNYLPGDQRLVDKIVSELKSQGIFDQFRKECFADVDTKPAYQNLRQRVEGNVSGFLRDQSWRPDMNKNQVREMLRKKISESGYLETGVERIVDQVVNPKMNTTFLPKVEEVVYRFLGIQKPSKDVNQIDLLPTDLEAVSPEPELVEKKFDKSVDNSELEDSKIDDDESPPFEPLDEQTGYQNEDNNSVDSHMSSSSILISHESNQSNDNKGQIELESQVSRNSSDSRLSIVTSDENSKIDICEDSQSKSIKSNNSKSKDQDRKHDKINKNHKNSNSSRSRHSSSSKDKDKKGSTGNSKDKSRTGHSSSSNRHGRSSSGRDRAKSESSRDRHESKSKLKSILQSHKSGNESVHSSSSLSSSNDRHRRDKEKARKKIKSKDDHYSSREKRTERRSTDRDSNDGSHKNSSTSIQSRSQESSTSQSQMQQETNDKKSNESNSDAMDEIVEQTEKTILKLNKPKFASNKEAMKLITIRKQLAKLEKQNQLSLATVDINTNILQDSCLDLDIKVKKTNGLIDDNTVDEVELSNQVISQDNWDEMEKKLQQVVGEFEDKNEESSGDDCKYLENIDLKQNKFITFVDEYFGKGIKRKIDSTSNDTTFLLPLSPAESDASKDDIALTIVSKSKRKCLNKTSNQSSQRYSSDDLYKPRPTFASSRRRGGKPLDN